MYLCPCCKEEIDEPMLRYIGFTLAPIGNTNAVIEEYEDACPYCETELTDDCLINNEDEDNE